MLGRTSPLVVSLYNEFRINTTKGDILSITRKFNIFETMLKNIF